MNDKNAKHSSSRRRRRLPPPPPPTDGEEWYSLIEWCSSTNCGLMIVHAAHYFAVVLISIGFLVSAICFRIDEDTGFSIRRTTGYSAARTRGGVNTRATRAHAESRDAGEQAKSCCRVVFPTGCWLVEIRQRSDKGTPREEASCSSPHRPWVGSWFL